jgi:hypothetical protein
VWSGSEPDCSPVLFVTGGLIWSGSGPDCSPVLFVTGGLIWRGGEGTGSYRLTDLCKFVKSMDFTHL